MASSCPRGLSDSCQACTGRRAGTCEAPPFGAAAAATEMAPLTAQIMDWTGMDCPDGGGRELPGAVTGLKGGTELDDPLGRGQLRCSCAGSGPRSCSICGPRTTHLLETVYSIEQLWTLEQLLTSHHAKINSKLYASKTQKKSHCSLH